MRRRTGLSLIDRTTVLLVASFALVLAAWTGLQRLGLWADDPASLRDAALTVAAASLLFFVFVRLSLAVVDRYIRETALLQAALYRVSTEASAAGNLREFYASIHNIVAGLMDATNFYVAVNDPERRTLNFEYFVDEQDDPYPNMPDDQGLTGKVFQSRRPYLYSVDRSAIEDKNVTLVGRPAVDWLGVPLLKGDRALGVLVVQSYTRNVRYNEQHLKLLTFVSEHIVSTLEQKQYEERLRSLSLTDELTGLANRRGFLALAGQALKMADRSKQPSALFFADLDCMKEVNDNLGHQSGDRLLAGIADLLRDSFRDADIIARIGGDEFVVLAYETGAPESELQLARVREHLERMNQDGGLPCPASISIGIEIYQPGSGISVEQLLDQADRNMYRQKNAGRGGETAP